MYNSSDFLTPRFPSLNLPELRSAKIEVSSIDLEATREQKKTDLGYAHVLYERLMAQIREFEKTLKDDEEIAA